MHNKTQNENAYKLRRSIKKFSTNRELIIKIIFKYISYIRTYITVEPLLLLYLIPFSIVTLAIQNLYLEKACRVNKNFGDKICTKLMEHINLNSTKEGIEVQKLVAKKNSWVYPIQMGIPAIAMLFTGAWSDKHYKRKLCMLVPIIGQLICYFGMILSTYFTRWPVEILGIFECLPTALSGGPFCMIMASFSYIADNSDPKNRILRFSIVYLIISIATPLGSLLSGILLKLIGFYGVFSTSICILISGFIYGCIIIKDKNVEKNSNKENISANKHIYGQLIHDTFMVLLKKRSHNRRLRIILIIICNILMSGPTNGTLLLLYIYARMKFNVNEIDYSIYLTYSGVMNSLGLLIASTLLCKVFMNNAFLIAIICSISKTLACFVFAFAPTMSWFFLGPAVEIVGGCGVITLRSMAIKLVDLDEIGKMNSLFGISDAVNFIIYPPIFDAIYVHTIEVFPGALFMFSALMFSLSVGVLGYLHRQDVISDIKPAEKDDINNDRRQPYDESNRF